MLDNLKSAVYEALEKQPATLGQFILEYFAQREQMIAELVMANDLEGALQLCRSSLFSAKEISTIAFDEIAQQLTELAAGIDNKLKSQNQ